MNWEATHSVTPFGGKDVELEADECEVGRNRTGLHGHDADVKGDFRGLFERSTGRLFIEVYDKLKKDEDGRRFGPPTIADVRPFVEKVADGSILFTDGARAYQSLCKELRLKRSSVDHTSGEFVRRERLWGKLRTVSTVVMVVGEPSRLSSGQGVGSTESIWSIPLSSFSGEGTSQRPLIPSFRYSAASRMDTFSDSCYVFFHLLMARQTQLCHLCFLFI